MSDGQQPNTGAHVVARTLRELRVRAVFGLVGVPVLEIAEACIDLGIRFIGFRNEQAAAYAAGAYGYLTGRPGVCLVAGGAGVLHVAAGVDNANSNGFPLLLLAGSSDTGLVTKGAFQEMDAVSYLKPHTKTAIRPPTVHSLPQMIHTAYRVAWFGRPGASFIELPADLIQAPANISTSTDAIRRLRPLEAPPTPAADLAKIFKIAQVIKAAKAPLIVVGKGAAYAQAEAAIRELVHRTSIPFLPSPMGKGIIPDSHPANASSARSTALQHADVILLLGARLNWMFAFGEAPLWNPAARIIQVDISAEELGHNTGDPNLALAADITLAVAQLMKRLRDWKFEANMPYPYSKTLSAARQRNEQNALQVATTPSQPLNFPRAYHIIKDILHAYAPPSDGSIVYIAEGSAIMDNTRSAFQVSHPRLRLDAGTNAQMGVGLGYAIAAWEAYNSPTGAKAHTGTKTGKHKKVVCFEGDSAFGFSGMEVETMARYGMDVLIFVMNISGVYQGTFDTQEEWDAARKNTLAGRSGGGKQKDSNGNGNGNVETQIRSGTLGFQVPYQKVAEMCGGKGYFVRTEEELAKAAKEGFEANVPVVVNVIMDSGRDTKLDFPWLARPESSSNDAAMQSGNSKL